MFERLHRLIAPPPAVEQRHIELAGRPLRYTLKRSGRRRSIGLRIDGAGLTVSVPLRASETWLHNVLQEKTDWVLEKLDVWQAKQPTLPQWRDGQDIFVLGQPLTLRVVDSQHRAPAQRQDTQLWIYVKTGAREATVAQAAMQWYRREAAALFTTRVQHYAALMGVVPGSVKLSSARARWGSCTHSGNVRLNWQLIKTPLSLIDYVIVHELAHLIEMNHSAAFWRVVAAACPDYAARRRALRQWRLE